MNKKFNGWANYETWNVVLWISNDESLYNIAKKYKDYTSFRDVVMGFESSTPDKVRYDDPRLDIDRLDHVIKHI